MKRRIVTVLKVLTWIWFIWEMMTFFKTLRKRYQSRELQEFSKSVDAPKEEPKEGHFKKGFEDVQRAYENRHYITLKSNKNQRDEVG